MLIPVGEEEKFGEGILSCFFCRVCFYLGQIMERYMCKHGRTD